MINMIHSPPHHRARRLDPYVAVLLAQHDMKLYKTKTLMTRLGSSLCCDVPYVAVLQFPIVKKNIMICNNK